MSLVFWERVNKTIKAKGTKQEWLSDQTGIKYQTLRSWITKDTLPRVDDGVKIAEVLGTTAEYLVTGVNSPVPKEMENFFSKYKKFSLLLEDLSALTMDQVDTISATVSVLVEKNNAKEKKMA